VQRSQGAPRPKIRELPTIERQAEEPHDGHIFEKRLIEPLGDILLNEFTAEHFEEWKRRLKDGNLSGKTVLNYSGLLHKAFEDAVTAKLMTANPLPPLRVGRRAAAMRKNSKPLTAEEVRSFLLALPKRIDLLDGAFINGAVLRDLYYFWFHTGWRPNEITALRFDCVSPQRQTIEVRRGRMPRGGFEASPKEGVREVICDYDPTLWTIIERRRRESLRYGRRDYVFTDSRGRPLSQELLAKRVWNPTIAQIGLSARGQYNIRDTFITLALSAGEDPGWVAQVCGNSEQMIFEHYRT
jgi:integrase